MANEDQIQEEETEYESSDEVDYYDFLEYSKDELARTLIKCHELRGSITLFYSSTEGSHIP